MAIKVLLRSLILQDKAMELKEGKRIEKKKGSARLFTGFEFLADH